MTLVDKWTKEQLQEMANQCTSMKSFAALIGYNSTCCYNTIRKKCEEYGVSLDHFTGLIAGKTKRSEENIFIENSTASQATLRKWYIKGNYTEYKCAICGLEPFWNNRELTLTLDHINGDNHDDRLENLRWVCPNCDRQLDTFCAKNANRKTFYNYKEDNIQITYCIDCGKIITRGSTRCPSCSAKAQRKVIDRPTKEELNDLLLKNKGNFTELGRIYNVTDNTIRKWCKRYDLPTHSSDYKEE